jgi:hypothetical protein
MVPSVPKRRHIKFRRRGITQKKEYNETYSVFNWKLSIFQYNFLLVLSLDYAVFQVELRNYGRNIN